MSEVQVVCAVCPESVSMQHEDSDEGARLVEEKARRCGFERVELPHVQQKNYRKAWVCANCASCVHEVWERAIARELQRMRAQADAALSGEPIEAGVATMLFSQLGSEESKS